MNQNRAYLWQPITDLSDELKQYKQPDLSSLADIWQEQALRLKGSEAIKRFNERLQREWAIETGIIEGLYSVDRGITQVLIERGIEASLIPHGSTDRPVSEILPILKDQEATLEGLFDFVAQRRPLSTSYIKELHQQLTRNQDTTDGVDSLGRTVRINLTKGDWKQQANNPTRPDGAVHEYCPPEHVASEMDSLVSMYGQQDKDGIAPEISAAWLHHRFTQIHPFQDGNGRVARALASLVFLKAGWFPLVINRDIREEYIDALEAADGSDLKPLVALVSRVQKSAFVRALSLSEDALRQTEPLDQVIARASDKIRKRKYAEMQDMESAAIALSGVLEKLADTRFREICSRLNAQLHMVDSHYACRVKHSDESSSHYFKQQIVEIANKHDYYADTRTHRAWVRLRIHEERETDIVLSFHGLGTQFLGVMAASAFLEYRDKTEAGQTRIDGPHQVCNEIFQYSYREPAAEVKDRFDRWLNKVVLIGLDTWQKQL